MWIYLLVYSDIKKCPPSSFYSLKALLGILILFNSFFPPVYTMEQDTQKILLMLKSVPVLYNNTVLDPSFLLMLPFCGNDFLEWIIHSTSELVMSFIYILYVTECVVQWSPCLMFCMDLMMMWMYHPFEHMFKIAGLICSLKAFKVNLLSPRNTSMYKPLDLYMLVTVFNSLMILSLLFEMKISAVRKVILDDFVRTKFIPFILKKEK